MESVKQVTSQAARLLNRLTNAAEKVASVAEFQTVGGMPTVARSLEAVTFLTRSAGRLRKRERPASMKRPRAERSSPRDGNRTWSNRTWSNRPILDYVAAHRGRWAREG